MLRKSFISSAGILLGGWPLLGMVSGQQKFDYNSLPKSTDNETYKDEEYWKVIQGMFNFPSEFINLENGYFSAQPFSTEQFHQNKEHHINHITSRYMRNELRGDMELTRNKLSNFLGCKVEELAITRNTTESLNTVISGYPWQKSDEVIIGNQDYGSMVAAFKQVEKRVGITVKVAQVPLHPKSDDEVVNAYLSLVTSKTKVIHLTHLINLSGQVIPCKKIIDAAHNLGIEVMVDAAHSVAHVDFKPGELNADYLAASLHKWLCCPLGVGILIIKQDHIKKIWPLMADDEFEVTNIRKFEHQGTKPPQTVLAINEAINFHNAIGSKLKHERLSYLRKYWQEKVKDLSNITFNNPNEDERNGAIGNISLSHYKPQALAEKLWKEHKIFVVAINHPAINGIRVTPHLFTTLGQLDTFVSVLRSI